MWRFITSAHDLGASPPTFFAKPFARIQPRAEGSNGIIFTFCGRTVVLLFFASWGLFQIRRIIAISRTAPTANESQNASRKPSSLNGRALNADKVTAAFAKLNHPRQISG